MSLGNYHHDFPRLAKQSGYFFQLYRGKVNWTEIEQVNIEEITENRNFSLLEQNLLNVINCNLEREYDLKILDQKFVKLFKIAQLGVDYLSYCEMYLDRCVVLLQEQLIAFQEEYETLKKDNHKKSEELKKLKKKNKTQSFQCEKCEKKFMSEVFLKHHDKRRHSIPNTPKSLDRALSEGVDSSQQTDNEKISESTQTTSTEEKLEKEEVSTTKQKDDDKIEHLKKELEDLKDRLQKAESTLVDKMDSSELNHQAYINYPAPVFYPPMFPYFPPYLPQNYYEISTVQQQGVLENRSFAPPANSTASSEDFFQNKTEKKESNKELKVPTKVIDEDILEEVEKQSIKSNNCHEDKENTDSEIRPLPFPRKTKIHSQNCEQQRQQIVAEPVTNITNNNITISTNNLEEQNSTPIIESQEEETYKNKKDEIFPSKNVNDKEVVRTKQSFFKKIVPNSPNLPNFRKSLRRSLTNLYETVSTGTKIKQSNENPVVGLNGRLKDLGIDPEWTGIPKKTLKEKLKALRHTRRLISKENPSYPIIRQKIEKSIFTTLNAKANAKGIPTIKIKDEEVIEPETTAAPTEIPKTSIKTSKPQMYNIETESESDTSDLPQQENVDKLVIQPPKPALKGKVQEKEVENVKDDFDLSIFQVKRQNEKETFEEKKLELFVDELQTDSDFDFEEFENKFKSKSLEYGKKEESQNEKVVTNEISKSASPSAEINTKKKVFFADYFIDLEKEIEEDFSDDSWSLEGDALKK